MCLIVTSSTAESNGKGAGCSLDKVVTTGLKSASANGLSGTWNDARVKNSAGDWINATSTCSPFFFDFTTHRTTTTPYRSPVCLCIISHGWLCGPVVRALDLRLEGRWVRLPTAALSGKLFTPVCLRHQAAATPYGWEGNRRFVVTLAIRPRLSGLSTYGLEASVWETNTPPLLLWEYGFLYLLGLHLSR